MGVLSESQLGVLRQYVAQGGGLIVTGDTAMFDEEGTERGSAGWRSCWGFPGSGFGGAWRRGEAHLSADGRGGPA